MLTLTDETMTYNYRTIYRVKGTTNTWIERENNICHMQSPRFYGVNYIYGESFVRGGTIENCTIRDSLVANCDLSSSTIESSNVDSSSMSHSRCSQRSEIRYSDLYKCKVENSRIRYVGGIKSVIRDDIECIRVADTWVEHRSDAIAINGFRFPITFQKQTDTIVIGCQHHSVDWWLQLHAPIEWAKQQGICEEDARRIRDMLLPLIEDNRIEPKSPPTESELKFENARTNN